MKPYVTLLKFIFIALISACCDAQNFEVQHWQTHQGAHVIFHPSHEIPMLDIGIAFRAGSAYDGQQFGLSTLTMRLLNQGNAQQNAASIADQLAQTGAQYFATNNQDMLVLGLRTLTARDAMNPAITTFSKIITHPDFPREAFEREKNLQLMSLVQERESPNILAHTVFYQTLYQQHPYAHSTNGDAGSLEHVRLEDIRHFYHRYFVGRNAVIVLVGDIDKQQAKKISEQLMTSLPPGEPASEIPTATALLEAKDIIVKYPTSQTVIQLGQLGITHQDRDYFPLLMGNYSLGGNPIGSRLAYELREQRGLTYGVNSQFLPMPGQGVFMINFATENRQASEAIQIARTTLTNFIKTGPTEQELSEAKQYLTGSFPLAFATNRNITEMLLKIGFYHLPNDFLSTYPKRINAVTTADIKRAFQANLNPDKLLQVTVGTVKS